MSGFDYSIQLAQRLSPGISSEYSTGETSSLIQSLIDEQRSINALQMEREDSAYQRMVDDMRKAGLNPWTGISSGGSSSSSINSPAKVGYDALMSLLSLKETKKKTAMQSALGAFKIGLGFASLFS